MSDLIGKTIGQYHILELLGIGGMATVYKAYDARLERELALKIIRVEQFSPADMARILKRFEREAKSLARLSHPNIVKVTDYGEVDGSPYLVMAYLPGGNLKQLLRKRGHLPWQEAVRLLLPIAAALDYTHAQNIVHRDVKPSNIMLAEDGTPLLTDFGVAKVVEEEATSDLTGTGMGVGTPEYMAPEQTGRDIDQRVDIYALGIVLFEMLTGHRPFEADTPLAVLVKRATEPLPRPSMFVPGLPMELEQVLMKALAKRPQDRYQSMAEMAGAMQGLLGEVTPPLVPVDDSETIFQSTEPLPLAEPVAAIPASQPPPLPQERKSSWLWWLAGLGGGGLLLTACIVAGVLLLPGLFDKRSTSADTRPPVTEAPLDLLVITEPPLDITVVTEAPVIPPLVITETPSLTSLPSTPEEIVDDHGIVMRLVPAGTFRMGMSTAISMAMCDASFPLGACPDDWFTDEEPEHTVYLDAFYMDKYEVSNAAYRSCVSAGRCSAPPAGSLTRSSYYGNSSYDNYPVISVTWSMADAYCKWRGGRLATEAEWEKAATGPDGFIFPWGDTFDDGRANFCDRNCSQSWKETSADDGYADTAPVDAFPGGASGYGILNLAGNVWEYVADRYDSAYYYSSPDRNPMGPSSPTDRGTKGGSFVDFSAFLRAANRNPWPPTDTVTYLGLRCVLPLGAP